MALTEEQSMLRTRHAPGRRKVPSPVPQDADSGAALGYDQPPSRNAEMGGPGSSSPRYAIGLRLLSLGLILEKPAARSPLALLSSRLAGVSHHPAASDAQKGAYLPKIAAANCRDARHRRRPHHAPTRCAGPEGARFTPSGAKTSCSKAGRRPLLSRAHPPASRRQGGDHPLPGGRGRQGRQPQGAEARRQPRAAM